MGNRATVAAIYEAFGRGDLDFVLSRLSKDVDWEHDTTDHGIPWLVPGRGVESARRFFSTIMANLEPRAFQVLELLEGERSVAAIVSTHWIVKETGRDLRDHEAHLWTFDEAGRVSRLKHFCDTAAHLSALSKL